MTRALGALACLAVLLLAACAGTPVARHRPTPTSRPGVAATPAPAPTAVPVTPAPSASPSPPTPVPTATSLIPHHSQSLTLSGAVTGTAATAEVKECGSGNGAWALELSSMVVQGGTASLTLIVSSYHGAGSYAPSGALNTIQSEQLATYPVSGGSVDIAGGGSSGNMNLTLTSSAGDRVQIQGSWACG